MTSRDAEPKTVCHCADSGMDTNDYGRLIRILDRRQLRQLIAQGSIVLLDAQAAGWFERERLPGAIRALPADLPDLAERLPLGKETEVAVYCWNEACQASAHVARRLAEMGYQHVNRYAKGKRDWMEAGLPTDGDEAGA